jgi:hypothetical protein
MLFVDDRKRLVKQLRRKARNVEEMWAIKKKGLVNPSMAEYDEFWADRRAALDPINEQIANITSQVLIDEAVKYEVPIPEFKEDGGAWVQPDYGLIFYLNDTARASLRSEIRKEKKERSEILRTWLTVVLSVIGAVTGVAALLSRIIHG